MDRHIQKIISWKTVFLLFLTISSGFFGITDTHAENKELENFSMSPFVPEFHITALILRAKKELIGRFGDPITIKSETSPDNQGLGGTIEKSHLQYEGMIIDVETDITSSINQPSWVRGIHIISSKYKLIHGLSVGASKNKYLEVLGNSYRQNQNTLTFDVDVYLIHTGTTFHSSQSVSIKFSDSGKSESITWVYHEH